MKQLVEELYLTNRGFITDDYEQCLDYIDTHELNLELHVYESGTEIWDSWVVPQKWSVNEAYVAADGDRIIDYDDHPLHLISYSEPFERTVSQSELLEHVHTHPELPEAIPWEFRQNYRPWDGEWGFCARQQTVDALDSETYEVHIDTEFEDGEMLVGEHHIEGERDETILLAAHLDHTGMANDDLAGVAVGCELMNRLQQWESLTYSYTFLIVQELVGSAAYLARNADRIDDVQYGIFLEMPGNDNRILLQQTFTGETRLDRIAAYVLDRTVDDGEVGSFRSRIGNDEIVFESPGFEIPTLSVTRFPYEEYHSHFDTPEIISERRLENYCSYVERIIEVLESDFVPKRTFEGLPSLANPKYDLYIDPNEIDAGSEENIHEFRHRILRYLDGEKTAFEIADEFDLDYEFVRSYLEEFEACELIVSSDPFANVETEGK
jgi:aminopeptidase-like protein